MTWVYLLTPPDRLKHQNKSNEIHRGKRTRCTPIGSRSFGHHACDSKFRLVSIPILRENTIPGGQGLAPYFPLPPPLRKGLEK
ncbi:hypothetical protein TNCV_3900551 [Trichonephila clavipes]|nr:hypothetical protein TNCV_3900551 [Trichonephila clavipes]